MASKKQAIDQSSKAGGSNALSSADIIKKNTDGNKRPKSRLVPPAPPTSKQRDIGGVGKRRASSTGNNVTTDMATKNKKVEPKRRVSVTTTAKRHSLSRSRSSSLESDTSAADSAKGPSPTSQHSQPQQGKAATTRTSKYAFGSKPPTFANTAERRRALGKESQLGQRSSFSELKAKYAALEQENSTLKQNLQQANEAIKKAQGELEKTQEDSNSSSNTIAALQSQIDQYKNSAKSNQTEIEEQHQQEHQALNQELRQKQQECRRLAKLLETKGVDSIGLAELQRNEDECVQLGVHLDDALTKLTTSCDEMLEQLERDNDTVSTIISDLISIS
mmetsp:Transcript_31193/g.41274  ORF Transcript_31193/g.41274 Transcript_31193/m.41274 type:complete len:333 (+) Transcript_31193:178-1176(+)|eukprot:CAMPEP_0117752268 /NCGR_PEP_ID=MMETSP0947-20121206/11507_1 /TAXON_ID=44440 /ORGANISM="Chattonella subsalsa, Strain CCMP2191" /LENGTH=332 /DNA_ID=CAMNT_0005570883 /DNA_START=268 /DNA_END=1266 /DNA_ORIENTATION=-